jgi:hypothetical protein
MSECGCQLDGQVYYVYCSVASTLWSEGNRHDFTTHIRDAVRRLDAATLPARPSDEEIEQIAVSETRFTPMARPGFIRGARLMRDLMLQRRPQPEPSGAAPTDACCGMSEGIGRTCDDCPDIVRLDRIVPVSPTDAAIEAGVAEIWESGGSRVVDFEDCMAFGRRCARWAWERAWDAWTPTDDEIVRLRAELDAALERAQRLPAPAAVDLGDFVEAVRKRIVEMHPGVSWDIAMEMFIQTMQDEARLHPTPPEPVDPKFEEAWARQGLMSDFPAGAYERRVAEKFWKAAKEQQP